MGAIAMEMEESKTADLLPNMRVLQFPPKPPVFLLEDWEIGKTQRLPFGECLPYVMYVDDQLRVHFEVNLVVNKFGNHSWRDCLDPMRNYRAIAPTLIEQSFLKNERRLLGGLTATFDAQKKCTIIEAIGLLAKEEVPDVPSEVRRKAFLALSAPFDDFNHWLGADYALSTTVTPVERMRQVGWEVYKIRKLKNLWRFYRDRFPLSLRRRYRCFAKYYRENVTIEK